MFVHTCVRIFVITNRVLLSDFLLPVCQNKYNIVLPFVHMVHDKMCGRTVKI